MGRHLRHRIGDPVLHKVDRRHGTRRLTVLMMLVISHNDHIIRHDPLFFSVVVIGIAHRHIVVHRKHDAVLPAGNREFPDKLHKRFSSIQTDILKVDVDTVQPVLQCRPDQAVDQMLSGT